MADISDEFIDAYNQELTRLGCKARIAIAKNNWHSGSIEVFDQTGVALGFLPDTIESVELAPILHMVDRAYQRGHAEGMKAISHGQAPA